MEEDLEGPLKRHTTKKEVGRKMGSWFSKMEKVVDED